MHVEGASVHYKFFKFYEQTYNNTCEYDRKHRWKHTPWVHSSEVFLMEVKLNFNWTWT